MCQFQAQDRLQLIFGWWIWLFSKWQQTGLINTAAWQVAGMKAGLYILVIGEKNTLKTSLDGKNRNYCTSVTENVAWKSRGCRNVIEDCSAKSGDTHKMINCKHRFARLARQLTHTNTHKHSTHKLSLVHINICTNRSKYWNDSKCQ